MSTIFSVELRRMVCLLNLLTSISPSSPDLSGTGAVYSFDPVGSYEREACRAAGAAQSLVQPFLDNQASLFLLPLPFRFQSSLLSTSSHNLYTNVDHLVGSVQCPYVIYSLHRSTSKTRLQHPEQHTQLICRCLMCYLSLSIHSRALPNVTSR